MNCNSSFKIFCANEAGLAIVPAVPDAHPEERLLLTALLKQVSRSFHLTLRVLPKSLRPQIGLAYLLARTADTIADTELVPLETRLELLEDFRDRILGNETAPLNFGELARQQGSPGERVLLEKCETSLSLLERLSVADRQRVREVLDLITSGQELDLRRFANASAKSVVALKNDDELDDYTYRVAGCVGEFWTDMCLAHEFTALDVERTGADPTVFAEDAVRFGKGLQLVNILRDLAADLQKGRCYLPSDKLANAGLLPADLLQSAREPQLRPLYNSYLDLAQAHLIAGWRYTNSIPRNQTRIRLACAWPILIGLKTIDRLRAGNPLDAKQRIKISRGEVRGVILKSIACLPLPSAWRKLAPGP